MDQVRFLQYKPDHWKGLLNMYLSFEPKGAYQGLPPYKETVTKQWLRLLLNDPKNINFILARDNLIFAHSAMVYYPKMPDSREIIIFVHQLEQHKRWGRKLFLATMGWACRNTGMREAWLTVDWHNLKARRLYSSVGFERASETEMGEEIHMSRKLNCPKCLGGDCAVFSAGDLFNDQKGN